MGVVKMVNQPGEPNPKGLMWERGSGMEQQPTRKMRQAGGNPR